ncbi:4223_t:CDS:2 [Ambispora leptoticha]|uniref:4223_t:CDS:1 n=1 Tax=Ambispora leptoticha TaxID=144679 RepID=A0A9N9CGZ4_9GLOM|nr:4223_t:CDS:2 [Ambispora leptoticha]
MEVQLTKNDVQITFASSLEAKAHTNNDNQSPAFKYNPLKYNLVDENQEDTIIAVQENVVNVEEGAVPKLSPEELVIYNSLKVAEKVTFLKTLLKL